MSHFESKKRHVKRELEKMGYKNIPEHQLHEFTADLQRLICHDRASRGTRSQARSTGMTSPSSRGGRDSSYRSSSPCQQTAGISARSSQYYRPDSGSGLTTNSYRGSPGCSGSQRSSSDRPRRKVFRCVNGRRVVVDETTSGCSGASQGSEFVDLRPELASDGTPEYSGDCDCDEDEEEEPCTGCDESTGDDLQAMCARPFPRLRANPIVPPELLPPRPLTRPGFRVTADMLAHPIRSDPCTRMKWYQDYWDTLKIPGIYRHHSLMAAVRNMLDTYDYLPRPLNKQEPVWNMSLLREQPTAMLKLNWC